MKGCPRARAAGTSGAALVEFAISLLAILVLLFAILDFGKLVRESNIIIQATHSGARSGAALATASKSYWCSSHEPLRFTQNCEDVLQWPVEYDALGSEKRRALEGGLRLTCSYIKRTGLIPHDWTVQAEGPLVNAAEGTGLLQVKQQGMKISVQQAEQKSRCLTCFMGLFSSFFIAEESYFAFQFVC